VSGAVELVAVFAMAEFVPAGTACGNVGVAAVTGLSAASSFAEPG
jgi:hypothetical protein